MNTSEGQVALLIYCSYGLIGLIINGWFLYWRHKRAKQYYRRKEHILDQASLRLREMGLLIEEICQNQKK